MQKTKVFTRQITAIKLGALFTNNRELIQNKTIEEIYDWVKQQEGFDFGGKDSLNIAGVKSTLDTLGIEVKNKRKPVTDRRDRVRVMAASMIRLAERIEKSIGADPGTILDEEDRTLLESL